MNTSIYLPEQLEQRLKAYVRNKGTSRNAVIRRAIELLLDREKKSTWGSWIKKFEGDPEIERFESYRSDLKEPKDNILANDLPVRYLHDK